MLFLTVKAGLAPGFCACVWSTLTRKYTQPTSPYLATFKGQSHWLSHSTSWELWERYPRHICNRQQQQRSGEHATQLGPEDWHLHPSSPISYQSYTIVFSLKDKGLFIIFIVHLSTHLPSTYPPHHPLKTLCWELTVYQTPSRASSLAEKKTSKLILRITCDQCWCVSTHAQ